MNPESTLRALRLEAGLTQQQLADKAGLDRSWLNQMERGKKKITRAPREKLAAALEVSPLELGGDERDDLAGHRTLSQRLEALEAEVERERKLRLRAMRAVTRRLADLEVDQDSRGRPEAREPSGQQ